MSEVIVKGVIVLEVFKGKPNIKIYVPIEDFNRICEAFPENFHRLITDVSIHEYIEFPQIYATFFKLAPKPKE